MAESDEDEPASSSSDETEQMADGERRPHFDTEELSVLKQNELARLVRADITEKRCIALLGFVFVGIIVLIEYIRVSSNGFDLTAVYCPENTYVFDYNDQTLCVDCLAGQENCEYCSEFGICDQCKYGFYQGDYELNFVKFPLCKPCATQFTSACLDCNEEQCLECEAGMALQDGECETCGSLFDGALLCDDFGALSCDLGYHLVMRRNETNNETNVCQRCTDTLDHCLECSNSTDCQKCNADYFTLTATHEFVEQNVTITNTTTNETSTVLELVAVQNGTVCSCLGGEHAFFDTDEDECQCLTGYARTVDGCNVLADLLGEECRITGVTENVTQIAFADQYLQPNGSYALCQTCAYGNFKITEEDGEPVSKCMSCDERFPGCHTCGSEGDRCRSCRNNYVPDLSNGATNMTCDHCNTIFPNCAECETRVRCDACEEGYRFGIFGNSCDRSFFLD